MGRNTNQYTYSQTNGQSTSKPNTVHNYSSDQKGKAPSDTKINLNQIGNRINTFSNAQVNPPLAHRDFDQRKYQQNLNRNNIRARKTYTTRDKEYHQQNQIKNIKGKNKYAHNVQKKDSVLSTSKEMNKTFQYNNVFMYYSPNFKKKIEDKSQNKSGNIQNISEISKKLLPNNSALPKKNGSDNNSFPLFSGFNDNNYFEKRNIREDINRQEPQKKGLFNKIDDLIDEIRAHIEETKSARIASQNQIDSLIKEIKEDRDLSKKQHGELMEKFDILLFGRP